MVTNKPVTSATSEGSGTGAASIYRSNTHTLAAALTQDDKLQRADPNHIGTCTHEQKLPLAKLTRTCQLVHQGWQQGHDSNLPASYHRGKAMMDKGDKEEAAERL